MANKNNKKLNKNSETDIVYLTFIIVVVNVVLVYYTYQSNERAEKLFVGQNKPLIDVTPIRIAQIEDSNVGKHGVTLFSIANYSGFVAKEIRIDVKYGDNDWISEWIKANEDNKINKKNKKEGIVKNRLYKSTTSTKSGLFIPRLEPGETEEKKHVSIVSGSLDLENQVCSKGDEGFQVLVRVTWENIKGHVFDEIRKYRLICTKVESGRALTFIYEGIISYPRKELNNINK